VLRQPVRANKDVIATSHPILLTARTMIPASFTIKAQIAKIKIAESPSAMLFHVRFLTLDFDLLTASAGSRST